MYNNFSTDVFLSELLGAFAGMSIVLIIFLVFLILALSAFLVVCYILNSIALSTIARNRGISNPWLAWIPVANYWLMGDILDYYYMRQGKPNCKFKIWFLALGIAGVSLQKVFIGFFASIGATVLMYILLYNFYKAVSPQNNNMYFVLSIIFPVTIPFFLYNNKDKFDLV